MKRVLILGGGTAGSIVANKLARELRREIAKDEVEITILDKSKIAANSAGFTFVPFGYLTKHDLTRNRESLISPRVKCIFDGIEGKIQKIDIKNRNVVSTNNKVYSYDYLVIALGSIPITRRVKGLSSQDFNSFYTSFDDALNIREKVNSFTKGNIVILVAGMPIPCPGAPAKFSILLSDYLRYVREYPSFKEESVKTKILWPTKSIGPPAYNGVVEKACQEKKIEIVRDFNFSEIDEPKKEVVAKRSGDRIKYDLLITVPPFSADNILRESELTDENGWIPTNQNTLQYCTSSSSNGLYEEVYAIGDNGHAEIPKTGVAAHYQALTTSQNIINDIHGAGTISLYRGEAGCPFVESSYTSHTRGKAYIPIWTYDRPPQEFPSTELGWLFYRMYYYLHWDSTIKGLM